MATVASGLNSGSGFSNSDTVTSTTLNNHVNDATVTDIGNDDIASNAAIAVTKLADITNNNLVGRVDNANNANVPIVIGGSGDAGVLFDNDDMLDNSDTAGGSATRGATQQSIKAYIDSAPNFTPSSYTGGESVTLPNGLIMKFGTVTGVTSQTTIDITFGTAFPNEIICVQLTGQNTSGNTGANGDFFYQVTDQSLTTKITILHQQPSASTSVANNVNWLVIGR